MSVKVPTKRNGYYYIDGQPPMVSVTKILQVLNKPALLYWYGKSAAQIALADPNLNEKEVMAKHLMNIRETQSRGKAAHLFAQQVFDGQTPPPDEQLNPFELAFMKWYRAYNPTTVATEVMVWSNRYEYAGRLDVVVELNNQPWILDIKTGKAIYREVGLQLVAYRTAFTERQGVVEHTGVLLLMETGEYQFKMTDESLDDFLAVKKVWEWTNRRGD